MTEILPTGELLLASREHDEAGGLDPSVVVVGAGPAGLTAALFLTRRGVTTDVLECDDVVGGISRTVERDGWRFDIGGHRFFTKVSAVEQVWHDLLSSDDLVVRPRLSRIYYDGRFYSYPLNALNALRNLGVWRSLQCMGSYAWARIRPPADQSNFAGWVEARFGRRLYETFFKTYTEKVWGVPADQLQADWAAQRIKNLSLGSAVLHSLRPRTGAATITSLIEEFQYPRLGPGMMWESCRHVVEENGGSVSMNTRVEAIEHRHGVATAVESIGPNGLRRDPCLAVISSMPIGELVRALRPAPPPEVLAAADGLHHRDFLTVALIVPEDAGFADNWIYVHSPTVRLGRVQNFRSWSSDMVKPGLTCLGLEYFVNVGDEIWEMDDAALIAFAAHELSVVGLVDETLVEHGYVVRMPKAYPVYDKDYADNVDTIRAWLEVNAANVHPVGRNGMHRYNNQDHSMLTAMLAVENILDGAGHDLWSVNVEAEYHEETPSAAGSQRGDRSAAGTGRSAPVLS